MEGHAMTAFVPDKKDLEFEAALQAHPLYHAQWEPVRDWLRAVRNANSPGDYYELHRQMLNWFFSCQKFEDECRERKKLVAAEIRSAVQQGAGRDELKVLSDSIAAVELDQKAASAVLAVFRDVADGLVWRLFRYQRPVIAALGDGRVVGRLSDEGLDAELSEIQALWEDDGVFALHADLTTCIRNGDVVAFDSLDPLRVHVTESKRSGRFNPESAQGLRLKRIQELIERGAHPEGAAGEPLEFDYPGIAYATYHDELRELVAESRKLTYVYREVDPGVLLHVWDEANPADLDRDETDERHARTLQKLGWTGDQETITASASLRRVRGRRLDHNFASLAPLSLAPLPVDDAADLILGRLDFISTLHLPTLEERFRGKGIEAAFARGPAAADSFFRASRGGVAVTVPAHVREQVQIEQMKVDTLIGVVDWFLTDLSRRGDEARPSVSLFYEREDAVWEAPEADE
jgi:truncated hemoglobin YjbI